MGIFDGYLLVSDMDGTLFDDNKEVSAENKAAIDRFMAGGGKFTVATGRMRLAVERYFSEITINAPAIMHNGALVYDFEKDKVISKKFIERDRKEIYKRIYRCIPRTSMFTCTETAFRASVLRTIYIPSAILCRRAYGTRTGLRSCCSGIRNFSTTLNRYLEASTIPDTR